MQNSTIHAFFALVQAGLWEMEVRLVPNVKVDFKEIMRLADEQSVVGLVTAGLEHVTDVKVPQEDLLQFVGLSLQIEQQNTAMNNFIGSLVEKMRRADIYALLVKGQGIAQCYERPLWRSCGDVDLYLSNDNYSKAKKFFRPLVESFDPDNAYSRHINMHYKGWVVEIHGDQHFDLSQRVDRVMDEVHNDIFYGGKVRSILLNGSSVFLPSPNNDVIIIFTHFLRHFFKGGIGLRQICDWCRLLWIHQSNIDVNMLEQRLHKAGLMSEWQAFAAYAVDYLGMPYGAMPFYDDSKKWHKKAYQINDFILEVGNFGHNRDSNTSSHSRLKRKLFSFNRKIVDIYNHAFIFPVDSFRFFVGMTMSGIKAYYRGE